MQDVARWLEQLGLSQYADAFAENDIDEEVLPELTEQDLKDLGISLGHRKKLLKAISSLSPRALGEAETPSPETPPEREVAPIPASEAERRQLTVMFCDLVGSTELSQRLDPEDLREVMRAFQDRCAGAISRFGGFIARYMGDGLLVYFGFPKAYEDAPERAIRSGLDVLASMDDLNREIGTANQVDLSVRVGIATGTVVVGDIIGEGAAAESAVIGETPNLAARLQAVAQPNQMVISESTHALLSEKFEFEDLGRLKLKGIAEAVGAWRVVAEQSVERQIASAESKAGRPLVGRQEELGLLLRAWEASKEGHGQVVLITGEPGIGKSRLLEALRSRLEGEDYLWNAIRCSPYHTRSAFYPVTRQLERVLRWQSVDGHEERLAKLEQALEGFSIPADEAVPLLGSLLSLPIPEERYPPLRMTPQQQRQMTLDAVAGWLFEEAERRPVLQVWEDIHWADPSTLELLDLYIEQTPTAALLNVLTFRPDFVPQWHQRSHMTPITLNRLERAEVETMITDLVDGKAIPEKVAEHIAGKADGVPLYVEELTKSILHSPLLEERQGRYVLSGSLEEMEIPATLQDSLMSRLDRVPMARDLAQVGAVLGREFAYDMLSMLADMDEATLREGLEQLVSSELLYQRGRPPRARYVFKHALIQDAAYRSLLKRSRQRFHRQVAELMEARFPELVAAQPELVAHHYTEAACAEEAIAYWTTAGLQTLERWATGEAVSHLRMGLKLLEGLPRSTERDERELAMQMALGPALLASRGFAEPGLEGTYGRALELCESLADQTRACLALRGRQVFHFARGEIAKGRRFAEQLMELAQSGSDIGFRVGGHHALGQCLFMSGEFDAAKKVLDAGIEVFGSNPRRVDNWPGGQPCEQCHLYAAFSAWMLGYPAKARRHALQGLALSESLDNPISLLNTQAFVAVAYVLLRDAESAQAHAETAMELAREYHHPTFLSFAQVMRGAALTMQGQAAKGIEEMQQGIAAFNTTRMRTWAPQFALSLVPALSLQGGVGEGLQILDQEIDVVASTGERAWDAELRRAQGQLLLMQSPNNERAAEGCFHEALRIARDQNAKAWELRAATSLARLWQSRGRTGDARELLEPVYGWYSEGFDTPDLVEAKQLLNSVS
jgi:class 3 adenylate cyclase/predicted ATPase